MFDVSLLVGIRLSTYHISSYMRSISGLFETTRISGVYPRFRMEPDQKLSKFVFDELFFFDILQLHLSLGYATNDTHHLGPGQSYLPISGTAHESFPVSS